MVTELQKRCIEEASHEKLKNDAYAMLMNEEYYQAEIKRLEEENKKLKAAGKLYRNDCKNLREELKYYKEKTEFLNKVLVKYQEENEKLKEENISLHLEIEDLEEDGWEEDMYE